MAVPASGGCAGEVLPRAHSSDRGINEANLLMTAEAHGHNMRLGFMAIVTKTEHNENVFKKNLIKCRIKVLQMGFFKLKAAECLLVSVNVS